MRKIFIKTNEIIRPKGLFRKEKRKESIIAKLTFKGRREPDRLNIKLCLVSVYDESHINKISEICSIYYHEKIKLTPRPQFCY